MGAGNVSIVKVGATEKERKELLAGVGCSYSTDQVPTQGTDIKKAQIASRPPDIGDMRIKIVKNSQKLTENEEY